jgi:hypothetical protein
MPAPVELPPIDVLKELFEYRDGCLYWRVSRGPSVKAGSKAGCVNGEGYMVVGLNYRKFLVHRIAWALHGNAPVPLLDHVNGDKTDNRIENLRIGNPEMNMQNMRLRRDSTSGIKGVSWHKQSNRWTGQVWHRNKIYLAGSFTDKEECAAAVRKLREELHGEFARHE